MWTYNTRNAKIRGGGQIEVFMILNGYENMFLIFFLEIKESKITRGHNFTLVKKQSRFDARMCSVSQRTINNNNNIIMLYFRPIWPIGKHVYTIVH